jgi:hypothetical protein
MPFTFHNALNTIFRSITMRRIAMGNIKEILKFSASGLSRREIAAATGASLGTVHTVLSRVNESGVKDPLALSARHPCVI